MEPRLLEYMLRVAELGSINKAATDLHVSQPALSRHIAALEKEMGTKLFQRSQGGVKLTDSGKLLADKARPLLRQLSIIKEQVGEMAAGQLAIGIPPSWNQVFTTGYISQLVQRHPDIKLRVHEGVSHILREQMLAGILDLCVIPFDFAPPTGFKQTPLAREPLVVVGGKHSGLSPDNPVPLNKLDGVKLVLPGRPNQLRVQIEHMLARKGFRFNGAVETDTLSLCLQLAKEGFGLTVVPACAVSTSILDQSIHWSPIKRLYLTWSLFENQSRSHSQAVREGKKLVFETIQNAMEKQNWYGLEPLGILAKMANNSPSQPA
tara:strand:- start:33 stop:992 length:960 start_codon:yes stop_codon:yes gene_type:complete